MVKNAFGCLHLKTGGLVLGVIDVLLNVIFIVSTCFLLLNYDGVVDFTRNFNDFIMFRFIQKLLEEYKTCEWIYEIGKKNSGLSGKFDFSVFLINDRFWRALNILDVVTAAPFYLIASVTNIVCSNLLIRGIITVSLISQCWMCL